MSGLSRRDSTKPMSLWPRRDSILDSAKLLSRVSCARIPRLLFAADESWPQFHIDSFVAACFYAAVILLSFGTRFFSTSMLIGLGLNSLPVSLNYIGSLLKSFPELRYSSGNSSMISCLSYSLNHSRSSADSFIYFSITGVIYSSNSLRISASISSRTSILTFSFTLSRISLSIRGRSFSLITGSISRAKPLRVIRWHYVPASR